MSIAMTEREREAFLADVHVGVLGVARPEGPPSLTPVWYRYADGVVEIVTASYTAKVELLRTSGTASLCAQQESGVPAFATVEGPVTLAPAPRDTVEAIAARYLGAEGGTAYAAGPGLKDDTLITLRVERWRTIDFAKAVS
jgi:PPOX class probable F420-dependent enzyme